MFWTLFAATVLGIVLYHYLIVEKGILVGMGSKEEKTDLDEDRFIQRIEDKRVEKLRMKVDLADLVAREMAKWGEAAV